VEVRWVRAGAEEVVLAERVGRERVCPAEARGLCRGPKARQRRSGRGVVLVGANGMGRAYFAAKVCYLDSGKKEAHIITNSQIAVSYVLMHPFPSE
jgi:hypothetical protein